MSEMGWVGMALPAEYGGGGNSFTDVAILFEELGYACLSSPLHSSVLLGGLAILEAGSPEHKREILPSVANGSRILALALTEPEYGWSPDYVTLQATRRPDGYALNGIKLFVPDAQVADQILVVARTSSGGSPDAGLTLFLVDKGTPGLSSRVLKAWTGDKLNEVFFDNVKVPTSAVVGPVDGAWGPLQRVMDRATAVLCTYMVGAMQRLLEITVEYSQNRIHFGVPIATFQRMQDYMIDIVNQTESSRWTAYEALWKLDEGRPDASESVSLAKAVASQGFPRSAQDAHHVHGGTGVDMTYGMYLYTKKAKHLHSYLGDPTYHKLRVAQTLGL
jgi:alkylation response protein AidB-like acyl-CoA dehydrogenase